VGCTATASDGAIKRRGNSIVTCSCHYKYLLIFNIAQPTPNGLERASVAWTKCYTGRIPYIRAVTVLHMDFDSLNLKTN
jgi:hypothetical protein